MRPVVVAEFVLPGSVLRTRQSAGLVDVWTRWCGDCTEVGVRNLVFCAVPGTSYHRHTLSTDNLFLILCYVQYFNFVFSLAPSFVPKGIRRSGVRMGGIHRISVGAFGAY